MSDGKQQFHIRAATQTDVPFLADSWIEHLRAFSGGTRKRDVRPVVVGIIQTSGIQAAVLVASDDPNFILGYIIYETFEHRNVVHWVHLKHQFRRFGLGRRLIESAFGERPRLSASILPSRNEEASAFLSAVSMIWEYNPLILARRMYAAGNQVHHVS